MFIKMLFFCDTCYIMMHSGNANTCTCDLFFTQINSISLQNCVILSRVFKCLLVVGNASLFLPVFSQCYLADLPSFMS